MRTRIRRAALEDLLAWTDAGLPHESCAFLIGNADVIERIQGTPNVHENPRSRYSIDPMAFLDLDEALEATGEVLLGIAHSHPYTEGIPSATDLQHAIPGLHYVIVGYPDERPPGVPRSWMRGPDQPFQELQLEVQP